MDSWTPPVPRTTPCNSATASDPRFEHHLLSHSLSHTSSTYPFNTLPTTFLLLTLLSLSLPIHYYISTISTPVSLHTQATTTTHSRRRRVRKKGLLKLQMGNCKSCCALNQSKLHEAKVFDTHGNLRRVKVPIIAAELMVEEPGHVVSPVEEIRRTRRIPALRADDELSAGKVYLLVPVNRANCRVSELEMAIVEATCERRRRRRGSSKVLPAGTVDERGSSSESQVRILGGEDSGFSRNRLGSYRQWTPVLEPIYEIC